ncbi:uncharacterized protein LOC143036949 [Oratosquilla oratoria]|uniref:uncharacterized protein LOC143036949 n=1 Tax=Oratosquilla oratoria TaxID=337810 RepID=UPI003F7760C9
MMNTARAVLLGVAEVRLPIRQMTLSERIRVANVCHDTLCNTSPASQDDLPQKRSNFIGVIDDLYAMQEVTIVSDGRSTKIRKNETEILEHCSNDVHVACTVEGRDSRIVYIYRSHGFGRAAVVLQCLSDNDAKGILHILDPHDYFAAPVKLGSKKRRTKLTTTFNRGVRILDKKMNQVLGSVATQVKKNGSPILSREAEPEDQCSNISVQTENEEEMFASDGESSSEDGSIKGETDSKTEEYYTVMGLDAQVQERVFDNTDGGVDKQSLLSGGRNSSLIEAEIKYLIDGDQEYLSAIRSLEYDRESLSTSAPQFIRKDLTLLFAQTKALVQLHIRLHLKLKASDSNLLLLGEAFLHHKDEYMKYVYFIENIPVVDSIIEKHLDFFKMHYPLLSEKLRKPRMRLHYYVLTLESIQKQPLTDEEKVTLQKVIDMLKHHLKLADTKLLLSAIVGCPFDLTTSGTLLLHHNLTLKRGGNLVRRTYHVVLLEKVIVLCKQSGRNFQYIDSFRIDQVDLANVERGIIIHLCVRNGVRGLTNAYIFRAKNIHLQQLWIKELENLLYEETDTDDIRSPENSTLAANLKHISLYGGSTTESDTGSIETTSDTTTKSTNAGTWSHRQKQKRGAIRRQSGSLGRAHASRQNSGYSSDGDTEYLRSLSQHHEGNSNLPPLSVWSVFRELEDIYTGQIQYNIPKMSISALCTKIIDNEEKYISTLKALLHSDSTNPPKEILSQMRSLYVFHSETFLPELELTFEYGSREMLSSFLKFFSTLQTLYKDYLFIRCSYDEQMSAMDLSNPYAAPILQLIMYIKTIVTMQTVSPGQTIIKELLSKLRGCIAEANKTLMACGIEGVPFDLQPYGPFRLENRMKVRFPGQMMRQDCHVVLMDKVLLLLEPRPPIYRYMEAIMMDTVGIGPSDNFSFKLEVRTGTSGIRTFAFKTSKRETLLKWNSCIMRILQRQVERIKQEQQKRIDMQSSSKAVIALYPTETML